ncbi:MAG: GNAT family N-acetyltransferase [Oscillochloris sp.]|nr:GNAT family N-acetyltransferase [Oscillochloris sp.]
MTEAFLQASLAGDRAQATTLLGYPVAAEWLEERDLIVLRINDLRANPGYRPWTLRAIIERASGAMVGHIGFHTMPGPEYLQDLAPGGIELGYTVFPQYRRRGFAREAVAALISWAAAQAVPRFVLAISPTNEPSLRIAAGLGFQQIGSHEDPKDGLELIFARDGAA